MHVHLHITQNKVVWSVFLKAQENPCHSFVVLTPLAVGCCVHKVQYAFINAYSLQKSVAPCGTYTKATKPLSQTFTFTVRQRWKDLSISIWRAWNNSIRALDTKQLMHLLLTKKHLILSWAGTRLKKTAWMHAQNNPQYTTPHYMHSTVYSYSIMLYKAASTIFNSDNKKQCFLSSKSAY